ncbi:LAME_0G00518g1_1 [Lachancea meyersii CBS 8951]|uniref:LAME_0G00518g1_1 n=1 Tax=Lachancea meyersii CBS 8951 TaxID=1266667 RepID=A0A1G4K4R8_9SACH|nr:LAME_0G00518g1_1 [Lachancea meyersii CBS 8951]
MDTERLKLPVTGDTALSAPLNGDRTPSKRGHRHKRSFAISQDLDLVKLAIPGTPQEGDSVRRGSVASPLQNQDMSPRFFMSEESTYSHDVPNAIIDLDEALTTKPRSFASHRRAESAPAQLILPFRIEPPNAQTQAPLRIDEEEDSESDNELGSQDALMSPLRAKSQSPFLKDCSVTESPKLPMRNQYNNNSLKINKQKERYLNYTKHLPAASPQAMHQMYPQEPSFSSLSSDFSSGTSTAGVTYSPNTPIISMSKFGNRTPSPRKTFKFESQVYDLPPNGGAFINSDEEPRQEAKIGDGDTLTCTVTNLTGENMHRKSKSASAYESSEVFRISREILHGQPGDSVDLSRLAKPATRAVADSPSKATLAASEHRTVSDSAVAHEVTNSHSRRRRGKFNILFTIFSRFKGSK